MGDGFILGNTQTMSANFYLSSHRERWLLNASDLEARANVRDRESLTARDIETIYINEAAMLAATTRKLKLRQVVLATALVFLRRFYLDTSFCEFDPRLVAPTCLWLAAKVEEVRVVLVASRVVFRSPQHPPFTLFRLSARVCVCVCACVTGILSQNAISNVAVLAREMAACGNPYGADEILVCEFILLEELQSELIVYHSYEVLDALTRESGLGANSLETLWQIVNDTYQTPVGE